MPRRGSICLAERDHTEHMPRRGYICRPAIFLSSRQIRRIVFHPRFIQQDHKFIREGSVISMMFLLIRYVSHQSRQGIIRMGKGSKPLLPMEFTPNKPPPVNPKAAPLLHFTNQRRNRIAGIQTNQQMKVIRHAVDLNHSMSPFLDNHRDVFVEIGFP